LILVASVIGLQPAAMAQNAMPEIRFPETDQTRGGTAPQAPAPQSGAEPGSYAGWVHPSSPRPHPVTSARTSPADELNRAELNNLLGGSRGAIRGSIR
jgi:hypothetical protein